MSTPGPVGPDLSVGPTGRAAIIAGSGVERPLPGYRRQLVDTPYGDAVAYIGDDGDPIFLSRHGVNHDLPPHCINYRANVSALRQLGVTRVLATFTVGSIVEDIPPGGLVLVDQLLDFTSGRLATFYEGRDASFDHVDFTEPFCGGLRTQLLEAAVDARLEVRSHGTYVCTNGPRLETASEIRMYELLGGHVVGMTAMPEAALAREARLHYAGMAVSVNWAAGLRGVVQIERAALALARDRLLPLFDRALRGALPGGCVCQSPVDGQL